MANVVDQTTGMNRYDYFGTDVPGHRRPDGRDVKARRSTKGAARLVREVKREEAEERARASAAVLTAKYRRLQKAHPGIALTVDYLRRLGESVLADRVARDLAAANADHR